MIVCMVQSLSIVTVLILWWWCCSQVMQKTGVEGEHLILLLEDHQLLEPTYLELVNSLLSSGEIPGLFTASQWTWIVWTTGDDPDCPRDWWRLPTVSLPAPPTQDCCHRNHYMWAPGEREKISEHDNIGSNGDSSDGDTRVRKVMMVFITCCRKAMSWLVPHLSGLGKLRSLRNSMRCSQSLGRYTRPVVVDMDMHIWKR